MNRICLLSEQVANQIAAGEVIERPASVVKELVENALDAGSRRISVEIQAGGRSLIRVTDDGLGMSRDDALLSLERHATSKIRRAEDLAAITTMGFRGEALPSVASVSRMTLTTREREGADEAATQIIIHGGRLIDVRAAGSPSGTSVEVRQLFFNLPARRKFLRSEETETGHIHHYLTLAGLAYPEVAFIFTRDGRLVWQVSAAPVAGDAIGTRLGALGERIRALFGQNDEFLPVDFSARLEADAPVKLDEVVEEVEEAQGAGTVLRVWGFLGRPGVSRATRQDQHLFVNRRPVENRGLNYALLEGYHTALMKGRYPVCALFLEIDPAKVDVNIHPAKREVKFHNEREVRYLVTQAVRKTLLAYHAGESAGVVQAAPSASPPPRSAAPATEPREQGRLFVSPAVPMPARPRQEEPSAAPEGAVSVAPAPVPPPPVSPAPAAAGPESLQAAVPTEGRPGLPGGEPAPLLNVPLRLVGVIGRLYVVLESDRGLVLLDQHAAHERILFEQMLSRLERGQEATAQRLLLPETIELSARDAQFLREQLPTLTRLGVELSEFGERTFLLDALPPMARCHEPRRFILQLIDELKAAGQGVNTLRLGEQTIAKTVCRHAVKANDPLTAPELEKLIGDLRHCAMPYTCPHGRPTMIELSYRELEKKFGRLI